MKILWLDLNSSYAHASLALPALHAQVMHDPSLEWGVVSATINENPGMTAGEVVRHAPDIVAATCWLFNHEVLMHVLSRVKAILPRCIVALGGPEFLGPNEDFLRTNRFVDCVFRGEGEETFPQWLACWQQPDDWDAVTGLCFWMRKDTTTTTDCRASGRSTSWSTPNKAHSSTGPSRSCNWRLPAAASTPAHSV